MADTLQEEFQHSGDYTEVEDLVFLSEDSFEPKEEKEEKNGEVDNEDLVQLINYTVEESSENVEPERTEPSLEELANSDFIQVRQTASREIFNFFKEGRANQDELLSVITIMCKLADDREWMVRTELMEKIPSIASFCNERENEWKKIIRQQLVPITVKFVTDCHLQVRKVGQASLLYLLEQKLIDTTQLTEWLCPFIAQLATSDEKVEGIKVEAVDVMCEMAPSVGKELSDLFFLKPFSTLCSHESPIIRQVCLTHFVQFCKVVGSEAIETILFPKFLNLCTDENFGIRKICVETMVDMSGVVSSESRQILAEYYLKFLDTSNWGTGMILNTALQCLGSFIATFADPQKTGLKCIDDNGTCVIVDQELKMKEFNTQQKDVDNCVNILDSISLDPDSEISNKTNTETVKANQVEYNKSHENGDMLSSHEQSNVNICKKHPVNINESFHESAQSIVFPNLNQQIENNIDVCPSENLCSEEVRCVDCRTNRDFKFSNTNCDPLEEDFSTNIFNESVLEFNDITTNLNEVDSLGYVNSYSCDTRSSVDVSRDELIQPHLDNENTFNTFQYWRTPLPDVEIDLQVSKVKTKTVNDNETLEKITAMEIGDVSNTEDEHSMESNVSSEEQKEQGCQQRKTFSVYDQDIVPPQLLQKYLNMIEAIEEDITDSNFVLSKHCAFSLPGVAYTLGRKFWPLLRGICIYLTSHMQWQVRKTVAAYLHVLSVIIGPEYTALDLLPLFFDLLKDLDEVRFSLLLHLSDFLKHLQPLERVMFLPLVEEFLKMDNEQNWRFRHALAQQMGPSVLLYKASDVWKYFFPVASLLVRDKISEVRQEAISLMAIIVKHLMDNDGLSFIEQLILDLKMFTEQKWLWRQTYALISEQIVIHKSLPPDMYQDEILPHLLYLSWDSVPNVRLAVSRCISRTLIPMGYLSNYKENDDKWEHFVTKVLFSLRNDTDRDVRYYAQLSSSSFPVEDLESERLS